MILYKYIEVDKKSYKVGIDSLLITAEEAKKYKWI